MTATAERSTASPRNIRDPCVAGASNATIRAKDIMTVDLVTVGPAASVHAIARLLAQKRISAVPVLEGETIVGIVSEGDLVRREELGTGDDASARTRGATAREAMTPHVVTVSEDTTLAEVAKTLETHRIRRVLVTARAKPVGIVSRADIVRALAARPEHPHAPTGRDDDMIRYQAIETLLAMPGTSAWATTVAVSRGAVELGGFIEDEAMRAPSRRAIESLPYVVSVADHRAILQPY